MTSCVLRVRRANVERIMGAAGVEMQQRAAPGGAGSAVARRAAFLAGVVFVFESRLHTVVVEFHIQIRWSAGALDGQRVG